ncbi:MAG: PDZ domain-containing protein [Planctomycetes bacterium]|nr:PDZ domain-containing protein [Planctomycetota bacterium]
MRVRNVRVWVGATIALSIGLGLGGQVARAATEEDSGPVLKIQQQTARSFVIVSYHLKKSDRPYMNEGDISDLGTGTVLQRILNKNAMDVVGIILNDRGEVFTFDREPTHREVIERITVRGPDGAVLPARAERLLTKAPGRILRIEGKLPASWPPLQFAECPEVTAEMKLYVATMGIGKYYHIYVRGCEYGLNWDNSMDCGHCIRVPGVYSAGVLCNAEGRPVGVTCLDEISLGPGGPVWRGKEILADPGLSEDQQKQLEEKIKREFARNIYEIRIMPRPEPQEEEEIDFGRRFRGRGGPQPVEEVLVYGLGFAENKLLIPEALPKELVAGIDTITVKVGNEEWGARFVGVLKDCTATVIELEKGKLPHRIAFAADGKVARLEPFWAVVASELAGMDVRTECSRWVDKQQGYADEWYAAAERPLPSGSWLLDRQGNLVGFLGLARHESDRLEPYLLGREQGRYRPYRAAYGMMRQRPSARGGARYGYPGDTRLFDAAEMAKMLAAVPAGCDPHIRCLDKDEQKRRVWLGVEYTTPEKEMIKQMNLREPTQDGRIGMLVNRVYPGSPAAQMGLTEGDILLKITVPGAPWPIELGGDDRESYDVPDFDEADIPREFATMGYQMPRRRPWPSQDNYVNRLLGEIGQGATVKLSYIHGTEILEKAFTIQQAPRDMLSAAKYKNEKLGLTVKDATYEVRAALRLTPEEPAIVAVKVEQGTPAALARINTYELIRAVDGVSVDNVGTFEKLITQAQEAKKDSVRLTVEWMGKTRLADLKFEAKPPAGMLKSLLRGREEP